MEKWERWIPTCNFPSRIYREKLVHGAEGLQIEFCDVDDQKKIQINFGGFELCYRNRDEGYFLRKIDYLDENYPSGFYSKWSLFKVVNSEFLNWFYAENDGVYDYLGMVHYAFITDYDVIEVLCSSDPDIIIEDKHMYDTRK